MIKLIVNFHSSSYKIKIAARVTWWTGDDRM